MALRMKFILTFYDYKLKTGVMKKTQHIQERKLLAIQRILYFRLGRSVFKFTILFCRAI